MKTKNKKKLEIQKKKETKSEEKKSIQEIEKDILSSPKNINLFNKIIESFINNLENKDEKNLNEITGSLKNIFSYFLSDKNVKSSNELISFLNGKIELIYKILIDFISESDNYESEATLFLIIFNIFHELINFVSEEKKKYII
jgi:hypothetical protein